MEYFGKTDIGKVRKENQDDFAIREDSERRLVAAVVCDGMGGAKAGGLASNLGTKTFMDYLEPWARHWWELLFEKIRLLS